MGFSLGDIGNIATLGLVDFDGPPQPDAPDYTGAAEATAAGNLAMAREATQANRANQITPWGTSTWDRPMLADGSYDPSGTWTQTTTLSPEQQRLFDLNNQTNTGMAETGLAALGSTRDMFETPLDFSGLGEYKNYDDFRQGIMDNMLTRSNTQIGQDREAMAAQLIAQGIPRGSEAFDREMTRLDQKQTDARQQAELAATQQTGQMVSQADQIRNQKIKEILTQRQNPLNELNAFRTGTQVQSPQFSAVPQQQTTLGPDYMGATTAEGNWNLAGWNADQAQNNAIMSGLFGLGSAAIGGL